eukprot:198406-Chlamydomonas_euryale.AAC.1
MKSASHVTSMWLVLCPAVCQQLFLFTAAFKATDFCQLLKDAIALPNLLLSAAAAAAPDGRGHLHRDIGNALDAPACGWVDCLDAFRPATSAQF